MSNTKRVATEYIKSKPFARQKQNGLFFYLHKITTNAIIKAIAMQVNPTKPKNSRYIICTNTISIAPPRFLTDVLCICKVATHSAYTQSLWYRIYNIFIYVSSEQNKIYQKFYIKKENIEKSILSLSFLEVTAGKCGFATNFTNLRRKGGDVYY